MQARTPRDHCRHHLGKHPLRLIRPAPTYPGSLATTRSLLPHYTITAIDHQAHSGDAGTWI